MARKTSCFETSREDTEAGDLKAASEGPFHKVCLPSLFSACPVLLHSCVKDTIRWLGVSRSGQNFPVKKKHHLSLFQDCNVSLLLRDHENEKRRRQVLYLLLRLQWTMGSRDRREGSRGDLPSISLMSLQIVFIANPDAPRTRTEIELSDNNASLPEHAKFERKVTSFPQGRFHCEFQRRWCESCNVSL